jgi:hypothetical protein
MGDPKPEGIRQDVESDDGKVTFNHLQQSRPEPEGDQEPDVITTDPGRITTTSQAGK